MRTILIGVCWSLGCMGNLDAPPGVPDAQMAAVVEPARPDAAPPDIVPFVLVVPDARPPVAPPDARPPLAADTGVADSRSTPDTVVVVKLATPACAAPQVVGGQTCLGLLCPTCTPDKGFTIPIPHARGGVPCLWGCGDARTSTPIVEDLRPQPIACSSTAASTGLVVNGVPYSGPVVCVPWNSDCDFCCPDVF